MTENAYFLTVLAAEFYAQLLGSVYGLKGIRRAKALGVNHKD